MKQLQKMLLGCTEITDTQFSRLQKECGKIGVNITCTYDSEESAFRDGKKEFLSVGAVHQFYVSATLYGRIEYQIFVEKTETSNMIIEIVKNCGLTYNNKSYKNGWFVKFFVCEAEEIEDDSSQKSIIEQKLVDDIFEQWAREEEMRRQKIQQRRFETEYPLRIYLGKKIIQSKEISAF